MIIHKCNHFYLNKWDLQQKEIYSITNGFINQNSLPSLITLNNNLSLFNLILLDITVLELTTDAINSLRLDSKTKGILVTEVGEKNENLLKNDVIIQVSSEKITDISSFETILSNSIKLKRDKLLLRVIRDGNEFWLINPFVIE